MKYTLAIVMLLGLTATNVEATMLEKSPKPEKKQEHKLAAGAPLPEDSAEDSNDTDDEDLEEEGSGAGGPEGEDLGDQAETFAAKKVHTKKPAKKSLLEMEDEQNEAEEEDEIDESDEEDDDDDEESEGEGEGEGEEEITEEEPEAEVKKQAKGSLVQLEGDDEVDHSKEVFKFTEHDMLGEGGYQRVTTPRFASDSDDIFMRSMIENYAMEGKNKDGSPNGQFWMTEALTKAACSEVLGTHKGIKGAELTKYLGTYFPRSWAHFDVNRVGQVEVIKMPQFMRFIASDQQMYLW
jgi:hypothetical protein